MLRQRWYTRSLNPEALMNWKCEIFSRSSANMALYFKKCGDCTFLRFPGKNFFIWNWFSVGKLEAYVVFALKVMIATNQNHPNEFIRYWPKSVISLDGFTVSPADGTLHLYILNSGQTPLFSLLLQYKVLSRNTLINVRFFLGGCWKL